MFQGSSSRKTTYMDRDFSEHEVNFKAGHKAFLDEIQCANSAVTQVIKAHGVDKKSEENNGFSRGQCESVVESSNVGGEEIDAPGIQPAEAIRPAQPMRPAQPKEQEEVSNNQPAGDPFDTTTSSQFPPVDDIFSSLPEAPVSISKQKKAETAKPATPATVASAEPTAPATPAVLEKKADKAAKAAPATPASSEFDHASFNRTKAPIDEMIKRVDVHDIDAIQARIKDYIVYLELDACRENPGMLYEKMQLVRNKMDSLHAEVVKLGPLANTLKEGEDRILTIGANCSSASSKEKREGQVLERIEDIWKKRVEVDSLFGTIERTYQHLKGQFECLSRMLTFLQMRAGQEIKTDGQFSVFRQGVSHEPESLGPPASWEKGAIQSKEPTPATPKPAVSHKPAVSVNVVKPVVNPKDVDDFDASKKVSADSVAQKGEIDW